MQVRCGIAGWNNPASHKPLRSAAQTHLEYYAEHFSCVEINSSFHRPHRKSTYAAWNLATPPPFAFSVKLPRTITHKNRLQDSGEELAVFFHGIEALQPKLRVVLVQLPPSLEFSATQVRVFFDSVPRLQDVQLVCEPRHPSWFAGAADALLTTLGVSRVAADPAKYPPAARPGGDLHFSYFRWHGSPRIYYSRYAEQQLGTLAAEVRSLSGSSAWCIFDNTAEYAAWDNALRFQSLAAEQPGAKS
jgi:uncharacterized protein YecE (DUF72 family)